MEIIPFFVVKIELNQFVHLEKKQGQGLFTFLNTLFNTLPATPMRKLAVEYALNTPYGATAKYRNLPSCGL